MLPLLCSRWKLSIEYLSETNFQLLADDTRNLKLYNWEQRKEMGPRITHEELEENFQEMNSIKTIYDPGTLPSKFYPRKYRNAILIPPF
jgi:hypothetical protein